VWPRYAVSLRDLHDPVALNAIGAVISSVLVDRNREWAALATDAGGPASSAGLFADVGTFFSKLFDVPEEASSLVIRPAESAALLLPLYVAHFHTRPTCCSRCSIECAR